MPPATPPRFSVVMPLFDKRDYVLASLATALGQSLPPLEVLVIDNGSRDGGNAQVAALADARVRLLHEATRGPGPARNRGIADARGDWIAFLDADDLWASDHLERLAEAIAACPEVALVGTAFRRVNAGEGAPPPAGPALTVAADFYQAGNADRFFTSSAAVRRDALLVCGGFAAMMAGEDTDLWIRLALTGRFALSPAITAHYVRGNGGIMEREQSQSARQAPPPSPVFATIAAALADPRHAPRRAALAGYGDGLRRRFAGQLTYQGHNAAARSLLRGTSARGAMWWALWLLSFIPGGAVRFAARLRRRLRV